MENGFKLIVKVNDDGIDVTTKEYAECGVATLEAMFEGETVLRHYRILMQPNFFEKPDKSEEKMIMNEINENLYGDVFIKISLRDEGSSITFDTDIINLLLGNLGSVTLGLIEPIGEAVLTDNNE